MQPKRTYGKSDMLPNQGHLQTTCLVNILCPDELLAGHISDEAPKIMANKCRLGRTQVEERQMVSALLQSDMISQPFDPIREHTAAMAVQQEGNRS